MDADTVVNIRAFYDFSFQPFDVVYFDPEVGAHAGRSIDALGVAEKQGLFAVVAVEAHQADIAGFGFGRQATRIVKG